MKDRSDKAKQYIAALLEQAKQIGYDEDTLWECWLDFAIMLGKFTPKWLFIPEGKTKAEIRIWNLLTDDHVERNFIGINDEEDESNIRNSGR